MVLLTQDEAQDRDGSGGEELSSCPFWLRWSESLPAKVEQVGTEELQGFRGAGHVLYPRQDSRQLGLCESLIQTYMNYVCNKKTAILVPKKW